jgi:hypothetical protein
MTVEIISIKEIEPPYGEDGQTWFHAEFSNGLQRHFISLNMTEAEKNCAALAKKFNERHGAKAKRQAFRVAKSRR